MLHKIAEMFYSWTANIALYAATGIWQIAAVIAHHSYTDHNWHNLDVVCFVFVFLALLGEYAFKGKC